LQNLNDYTWDLKANGSIDIEKMTKIFPLDGMSLAGKVKLTLRLKENILMLQQSIMTDCQPAAQQHSLILSSPQRHCLMR